MPAPMKAGLPPELIISDGYILRFAALDPTSGAAVAGVSVSLATAEVERITGNLDDLTPQPRLVPTDQVV